MMLAVEEQFSLLYISSLPWCKGWMRKMPFVTTTFTYNNPSPLANTKREIVIMHVPKNLPLMIFCIIYV